MTIDYDRIRKDNIRKYGEETCHLALLGRLYTDRTHFLYELLQNAEDAGATRIYFNLFDDRLEVSHNGHVFNERDVRGVCGVGVGSKSEDLTQIGKFGIGFKSVYAYTATPEIHSGGESFRIENYVRPYEESPKPVGKDWTTLFVFPFNAKDMPPETACTEIGSRLTNLNARTLLFLRSLNEIGYRLPNETKGTYLRGEIARKPGRQVSVIGEHNGKDEEETWLIFERPIAVPEKSATVRAEVAFRLEVEDSGGNKSERIVKISDSPLVVFFPTEKNTKLGFLIQGSYRTTPSRDNIPENDDWNKFIVKETAQLVRDILPEIKNLGLLSVSFLEALPINTTDFPEDSMCYPIAESIRNSLIKDELLPADDGSFVSAGNAKLARGANLRKLLNQTQLGQLFESTATVKWLTGEITQDRTPAIRLYLINELGVEEVTSDSFARKLSNSFLSAQQDEWFSYFYRYLLEQDALWREPYHMGNSGGILRSKPILRLSDGRQAVPFKPDGMTPSVFLPPAEETDFPVVSRSIAANEQALAFLKRLGLSEPDIFDDIVERVLSKYVKVDGKLIPDAEHKADLHEIVRQCSASPVGRWKVIAAAQKIPFLKATSLTGETAFKKPTEIYIDTVELRQFFLTSQHNNSINNVYFLHNEYANIGIDNNFWYELGIYSRPRILDTNDLPQIKERDPRQKEEYCENYDMHCLEQFLENIQENTNFEEQRHNAFVLWGFIKNYLHNCGIKFFKAKYHYFYYTKHYKYVNSMLLVRLKNSKWIPTKEGSLEKPEDITTDQLFDEFLEDANELIESLGISKGTAHENVGILDDVDKSEEEANNEYAARLGVSLEDIEFLKKHHEVIERLKNDPAAIQKFEATVADRNERPAFPRRSVSNPERRHERLGEQLTDAPRKKYEKRERSVRTTSNTIDPTTWLRNQYTNEIDQMVCQICKQEMPFRKRDGTYYFEKKEVLKYLPKEHEAQYLALCPLCAAKYEEFIKNDDKAMATLKEKIANTESDEISILLGDEQTSIRFVQTHLQDLQDILKDEELTAGKEPSPGLSVSVSTSKK